MKANSTRIILVAIIALWNILSASAISFTYMYKGQTLRYYTEAYAPYQLYVKAVDTSLSGEVEIPERIHYNRTEYAVVYISDAAFRDCSGMTSISIPNSIHEIGKSAFWNCSGLTSLTIPNSVSEIEQDAFYNCSGLTELTIGNSVSYIGSNAFNGCSELPILSIPGSVRHIVENPFLNCNKLIQIKVDDENPKFTSIDGIVYDKDVSTLLFCPGGKEEISIPESVTTLAMYSLCGCSKLTSLTFPS